MSHEMRAPVAEGAAYWDSASAEPTAADVERPHSRQLRESYQHLMVLSPEERAKAERQRILEQTQRLLRGESPSGDKKKFRRLTRSRASSAALLKDSIRKVMSVKALSRATTPKAGALSPASQFSDWVDKEERPNSRIAQALQHPSEFGTMHEWNIPIEQMSLDTSLYRDACEEADLLWMPTEDGGYHHAHKTHSADQTGEGSMTLKRMLRMQSSSSPPKSADSRAAPGAPRGIGRRQKSPIAIPSHELFSSLKDGKNILSQHKYCAPPWVKAKQEFERSRSVDPAMLWRPLSTTFDTEIPDELRVQEENSARPGSSVSGPAMRHSPKPPAGPRKVGSKEQAYHARRPSTVAAIAMSPCPRPPRPGSRCNTWQSCKRNRIIQQTTRPVSVQDFYPSWEPQPPYNDDVALARPATAVDFDSAEAWQAPGRITRPFSKSGSSRPASVSSARNQYSPKAAMKTRPAPLPMASDIHGGAEGFSMKKIQEDAMRHLAPGKATETKGHNFPSSQAMPLPLPTSNRAVVSERGENGDAPSRPGSSASAASSPKTKMAYGSARRRRRAGGISPSSPASAASTPPMSRDGSRRRPSYSRDGSQSADGEAPRKGSLARAPDKSASRKHVTISIKNMGELDEQSPSGSKDQTRKDKGTINRNASTVSAYQPTTPKTARSVTNPLERTKSGVQLLTVIHPNGKTVQSQRRMFRFSDEGVLQDDLETKSSPFEDVDSGEQHESSNFKDESLRPEQTLQQPEAKSAKDTAEVAPTEAAGPTHLSPEDSGQEPVPLAARLSASASFASLSSPESSSEDVAARSALRRKMSRTKTQKVNVLDEAYVPYRLQHDKDDKPLSCDAKEEERAAEEAKKAALELMISPDFTQPATVEAPEWLPEHVVQTKTWEWVSGQRDGELYKGSIPDPEKLKQTWKKEQEIVQLKNEDEFLKTESKLAQACASTEYVLEAAGGRADRKTKSDFEGVMTIVKSSRAQFQLPEKTKDSYQRMPTEQKKKKSGPKWNLYDSIFVRRLKECEAKDFFDTEKVLHQGHDVDWARVVAKSRFRSFIARKDKNLLDPMALHRELQEVYNSLKKNLECIRAAFFFYCMLGGNVGESAYSMTLNNWTSFVQDCGIVEHSKTSPVNQTALDTLFITVNFEEDKKSEESKENDDRALMRFEWYEIIVRTAVSKYGGGRQTSDISDSVDMLIQYNLKAFLPKDATQSSNDFRRERLYTFENDQILQEYLAVLESIYAAYKAVTITNYFWMEHWMVLLEDCLLIGGNVGVSKFEAKLIFCRAKMASADEFKKRQRVISHMFIDFLEAIVRLADTLRLPTLAELQEWLKVNMKLEEGEEFVCPEFPYWVYCKKTSSMGSPSIPRNPEDERPSHEHLKSLLDLLMGALCEAWEVPDIQNLCLKLDKQTHRLTRGRVKPTD